jgi:hypothetical protein
MSHDALAVRFAGEALHNLLLRAPDRVWTADELLTELFACGDVALIQLQAKRLVRLHGQRVELSERRPP